tara:strand:+ start:5615 stop:6613 length:999 start_codon:yes stop_codon:yes gene_type:complete
MKKYVTYTEVVKILKEAEKDKISYAKSFSSETKNKWYGYKRTSNNNYSVLLMVTGRKNNFSINNVPKVEGLNIEFIEIDKAGEVENFLIFELLDKNDIEIFANFCVEMINEIEQSSLASDNNKTVKMALEFTKNYQNFWRTKKDPDHTNEIGLLGELVFINDYLVDNLSEKLFRIWIDGSKDFEYKNLLIECKTNQEINPKIRISSEYQLETEEGKKLFIFLLKLCANNDHKDKEKITIHSVYEEIKNKLLSEEQKMFFSRTVKSKGFDLENLEEKVFSIDYKKIFHVDDEFPKIIKSKILNSISEVKYRISVNQIQEFEVENNEFTKLIKE